MAVVVALEADASAFALLVRNTAAYPNVIPVRARIRGATVQRSTGDSGGARTGKAQPPLFFPPALNTSNYTSVSSVRRDSFLASPEVPRRERGERGTSSFSSD